MAGTVAACYRVRSWCHQWLAVDSFENGRLRFSRCEDDSCRIALLPCDNGSYKLQVIPRDVNIFENSGPDVLNPERKDGRREGAIASVGGGSRIDWFLSVSGSCIVVTNSAAEEASLHFRLEFDEHGRVRIYGNNGAKYLSADARGRFWGGTERPQKWEQFTFMEEALAEPSEESVWAFTAPVRVTLQAHTGKYVCGASAVISANAEAACCCEEFLLDLKFPSLIPVRSPRHSSKLPLYSSRLVIQENLCPSTRPMIDGSLGGSICTIRTADGKRMLSAEPDGILTTTSVDQVCGLERFKMRVQYRRGIPAVIIQSYCDSPSESDRYLSATRWGGLVLEKSEKKQGQSYRLNLANGSRVLVRSIHGGYLACDSSGAIQLEESEQSHRLHRGLCTCVPREKPELWETGGWQLRYHGDSLYTLIALPLVKGGAHEYLSVDSTGRIIQSGAPAVHFPATASLFEIVHVSGACLDTMDENVCSFSGIVGFTIRTVRRIRGKQRYVSVEPNGKVFAKRLRPSRWEIFQFIDVDAAAAASSPEEFPCVPAAVTVNSPNSRVPSLTGYRIQQRVPSLGGQGRWGLVRRVGWVQSLGVTDVLFQGSSSNGSSSSTAAAETIRRACALTAKAISKGSAIPRKSPLSLQELCIGHVCWMAAKGADNCNQPVEEGKPTECPTTVLFDPSDPELSELVSIMRSCGQSAGIPDALNDGNHFSIPDDLLTRIWAQWRSREPPSQSCKWLPSSTVGQLPLPVNNGMRPLPNQAGRPPSLHEALPLQNIALWNGGGDGYHCMSCDAHGVLSMDPTSNPAHHRYLEVQYRTFSGARQPGVLWSAISFAGMSLMTTALACRVISLCRFSVTIHNS